VIGGVEQLRLEYHTIPLADVGGLLDISVQLSCGAIAPDAGVFYAMLPLATPPSRQLA
jgi:hypothetical protein